MRTSRLKLANLNSLRGNSEVNFEVDPLANAGLFAITGPTGQANPRFWTQLHWPFMAEPPATRAFRIRKTTTSRHCGECQAEVEFLVPKGRFRAEWQLRRARGKADGNLQVPKCFVYDANGHGLGRKIGDVEELIEDLVGLDYRDGFSARSCWHKANSPGS